jgi:hypothetical protein
MCAFKVKRPDLVRGIMIKRHLLCNSGTYLVEAAGLEGQQALVVRRGLRKERKEEGKEGKISNFRVIGGLLGWFLGYLEENSGVEVAAHVAQGGEGLGGYVPIHDHQRAAANGWREGLDVVGVDLAKD